MRSIKLFLLFFSTTFSHAQSFYVLTGVDSYDPLVINTVSEAKKYNKDIIALMKGTSKELGIDTLGHPSRVLVFVIEKYSLGENVGVKVKLELGEYVKRKDSKGEVFAITYMNGQSFPLSEEDNKAISSARSAVSHEDFAKEMQYETEYKAALQKAKRAHKPLLLFMSTSYCPWCRKLESQVLAREDIHKKINDRYIPLMLNFDEKQFPEQFSKEQVTPTLYIVNSQSEKIEHKIVGYNNRDEFLHILKQP
jgi:thioredoxin-related protein